MMFASGVALAKDGSRVLASTPWTTVTVPVGLTAACVPPGALVAAAWVPDGAAVPFVSLLLSLPPPQAASHADARLPPATALPRMNRRRSTAPRAALRHARLSTMPSL